MITSVRRWIPWAVVSAVWAAAPSVTLAAGSGPTEATAAKSSANKPTGAKLAKATAPTDHRRGRAPKSPAPTLPPSAARAPEDLGARRGVAGSTPEAYLERATDPELKALRAAEKVLFPELLNGFTAGWSWGRLDPTVQDSGLPPAIEALPSAKVDAARDAEWLASLALPDFPVRLDRRVVEYLHFYRDTEKGRAILQVWARKVGRYTAPMIAELAKAGLPRDLVWLSLIESGHNPTIYSAAGAAGIWQFIPDSARMYGLTVDKWVDERLDPLRSTQAAGKYLSDLYQRFGSWELAMAAYNMGHGGLMRSVVKYNSNDFWKLSTLEAALPWETVLYVPKVFALAIVMNNRRAFGIGDVPLDPAVSFDTVYVRPGVSLEDVARASGIPVDSLRTMNPHYISGRTPPPSSSDAAGLKWAVRVPTGSGRKTTTALAEAPLRAKLATFVVRQGDNIETVAHRCRTTAERLTALNELREGEQLTAGTVLTYPALAAGQGLADDREEVIAVPAKDFTFPGRKRVFYRVANDDNLEGVAQALGVSPQELAVWNELNGGAKLLPGMVVQAFVPAQASLTRIRVVGEAQTELMRVGSVEFLEHHEALQGRKRLLVRARKGDTLTAIGKRHGLSAGMMERINHLSRSAVLDEGQEVIVYATKNKSSGDDATGQGRPLARVNAPRPDLLPRAQ
jgi:membrane-bound lytic murein transglycosylase D